MRLEVKFCDQTVNVELADPGGSRAMVADHPQAACDWVRISDRHYSVILEGRVYDLQVEVSGESCMVAGRQGIREFRVRDPKNLGQPGAVDEAGVGLRRVCAEMPGKVVRVLVRTGDSVIYEQALLVIEAMKMQNEIRAPKAGVIRDVAAREGGTVNSGDLLVSLE